MSDGSGEWRSWFCPQCGRSFRIPAWADAPASCPRCAMDGLSAGLPPIGDRLWNLATAVGQLVADGCRTIEKSDYEARLRICDSCDQRREDLCVQCGCYLPIKSRARAMKCPLGKWPVLPPRGMPRE